MVNTIYIEKKISDHQRTKNILKTLKNSRLIYINHYGEIFNKKNQNFKIQKSNQSLILAYKNDNHVLKAPEGFGIGSKKNYYFSHMFNCIYDCRYCFLQGMYSSANLVLFINYEDFLEKINDIINLNKNDSITFFSGYDCDSLALEKITGFTNFLISNIQKNKNVFYELRTKSSQINPLNTIDPKDNVIVAYSLMPKKPSLHLDFKTPNISKRIKTITNVSQMGWKVGIRLDPLIYYQNWENEYEELLELIFTSIDLKNLHSVSIGTLRFPREMYKKIVKLHPNDTFLVSNLLRDKKNVSYHQNVQDQMTNFIKLLISSYSSKIPIYSCKSN